MDKNNINSIVGRQTLNIDDYFIRDKKHEKELIDYLTKIRCVFPKAKYFKRLSSKSVSDFNYSFAMDEIINFYNNDICIPASYFHVMHKYSQQYKFKVIGYYLDNIAIKTISCWEYLFQILSKYLGTNLLGDYRTRDRIIAMQSKKLSFVENGNGAQAIYEDYPPEILMKIIEMAKKEKKVLEIDKKNKKLKKAITKVGLSTNTRIERFLELYRMDEVSVMKEQIRNEIIHKRSLTFNISVNSAEMLPVEGISISPESWYSFSNFELLLDKNLYILKEAIQLLYDVIWLSDMPNSTENTGRVYQVINLNCKQCEKTEYITEEFWGFPDKTDSP